MDLERMVRIGRENEEPVVMVIVDHDLTPAEARQLAGYISRMADRAERENRDVQELVRIFEGASSETLEDMAVAAFRAGYRKQK